MLNVYAPGLMKKMFNLSNFINSNLSMVIAPAGYGKTHTIVQCVNQYDGCKKILILTHTHAGIAAIKDKLKRKNIPVSKYDVSTICGYTIMLMQDYHINKEDIPCIENTKEFYPFALNTARRCLRAKPIQAIIQARYDHLIVDEYQDCSIDHHSFILDLSKLLKTHILGDYMQSIFTFNGPVVDLNSPEMMVGFWENQQQLDTPWRWKNSNVKLGQDLHTIRSLLESGTEIDLDLFSALNHWNCNLEYDFWRPGTECYAFFCNYMRRHNPQSALILVPQKRFVDQVSKAFFTIFGFKPIESFDDGWFYKTARDLDVESSNNYFPILLKIVEETFNKECRSDFFNDNNTLINKREKDFFYEELEKLTLSGIANLQNVFDFLSLYKKKFSKKCRKLERLNAIMNAVDCAINEKISVYEGMVKNRDFARRQGRKVIGRYVGTTLLTKGLEFDVVFVLNPAEYSRNDLYVALTRASKDLLVISTKKKIIPKPEQ